MGIVSKKVVLIRWDTLPCDIREWFKEYFGPLFGPHFVGRNVWLNLLTVKLESGMYCRSKEGVLSNIILYELVEEFKRLKTSEVQNQRSDL